MKEHILQKLNEIWPQPRQCSICKKANWTLGIVFELHESEKVMPCRVPMVSVTCMTCGATQLFNAIVLGVIDKNTGKFINKDGTLTAKS